MTKALPQPEPARSLILALSLYVSKELQQLANETDKYIYPLLVLYHESLRAQSQLTTTQLTTQLKLFTSLLLTWSANSQHRYDYKYPCIQVITKHVLDPLHNTLSNLRDNKDCTDMYCTESSSPNYPINMLTHCSQGHNTLEWTGNDGVFNYQCGSLRVLTVTLACRPKRQKMSFKHL